MEKGKNFVQNSREVMLKIEKNKQTRQEKQKKSVVIKENSA